MSLPNFNQLKKLSKSNDALNHQFAIAVLADTSSQFFVTALKGYGVSESINFDIYEADYDQISMDILNPDSSFHSTKRDFVIILKSSEKLLANFQKLAPGDRQEFAELQKEHFQTLINNIPTETKIIINTFPRIVDNVFGNYNSSVASSFGFQLSALNYEIKKLSISNRNVFVCDIEALQNQVGLNNRIDYKFFFRSKMAYSISFLPLLVKNYVDIFKSAQGIQLRKCLILDLDNTMWGGVIGDDGMGGIQLGDLGAGRAFDELQRWAKDLKNRGIILCVCSKNMEHIAKEPFEKHPDMTLSLEDISVFVANWENKADNIRHIQEVLNIGFDSMVFLDDNPFERNLVRTELPDVTVPELPEDPSEYMNFVNTLNLFETASFSGEDNKRTKRYQDEAKRLSTKRNYGSIDDYLKGLEMKAEIESFNDFSISRISQLTQRSNQFNLRTIRYTEEEIDTMKKSDRFSTFQISLSDKYGEYGLISLVIGEKKNDDLFIDTWIMSCRVLKRDVEKFVLNEIVTRCKHLGIKNIIGEWLETKKNIIVKDHYKNLGFSEKEGRWYLDVNTFKPNKNYINKIEKKLA